MMTLFAFVLMVLFSVSIIIMADDQPILSNGYPSSGNEVNDVQRWNAAFSACNSSNDFNLCVLSFFKERSDDDHAEHSVIDAIAADVETAVAFSDSNERVLELTLDTAGAAEVLSAVEIVSDTSVQVTAVAASLPTTDQSSAAKSHISDC